ncbi:MAG: Gfo/Idh/MocA family oxidoreductase, partial [Candidatus Poribacteria bacterium]|nr:Gfo/Idh/MocA family oxidoreductase [Candidatus Poribacteria bacterium]
MTEQNDQVIRVAQIGVGYWGPNLLRNLMVNPQLIVKAVADLEEDRRVFVKTNYPTVTVERDPEVIIDDPDVDAVVIATPVSTHYDLAMRCVESGKHVLVEKPMATQVSQIEDIARVANNKNLVAMVGHTFLFNQAVRYIKDLIDRGELGDIRYIYSQRVNLGRIRNDVDAMWNLAPHDVSIIQYWLGDIEPTSIHRVGMDYVQKGINDVVFLNVIYPNDVMAHIHVSWLDPHKVRKITVVGSRKMVVYDDMA